jgi:hypothetical protein
VLDIFFKKIIISPENAGYYYWKLSTLIMSIVSSIIYSNYAAFRFDVDYRGYIEYVENVNFGFNHMDKFTIFEIRHCNKVQLFFELFFFIEMIVSFITEYIDHNNRPVRDIFKISKKYFREGFIYDIIPLIPFNFFLHFRGSRFLFLIKTMRLV